MAGKGIILNVFRIPFRAGVAKSVDAVDSKSTVEIRAGSSPAFGTIGMLIKSPEGGFFCKFNNYPSISQHHLSAVEQFKRAVDIRSTKRVFASAPVEHG